MADYKTKRVGTRLARGGMDVKAAQGFVNPPVYRGSTVLFPTMDAVLNRRTKEYQGYVYGLYATPTSDALVQAVHGLEGGYATLATASGLSAITHSIMGFVKSGDHILVADSAYGPTRMFCDKVLARFGVETTYYDPLIGGGIADLIRPESRLVADRIARIADLRGAGHPGHLRRGPQKWPGGGAGQHLGHPPLL